MAESLPKWLQKRYASLRYEFEEDFFSFKQAEELLGDDSRIVNLCLSELRKAGWLESERDPKDSRKKRYHIINVGEVYDKIAKEGIKKQDG